MNLHKKGQGSNYFAVIIVLFLFGLFSIIGYTIWLYVLDALNSTGFVNSAIGAALDGWTNGFRAFDYITIALLVILIIGTGILSFQIKTKTMYFIVTIILAAFWGFISYFFNYVFIEIVSNDIFNTAIGYFPRTIWVCTNLHWVMLILIIVGSITLYGKKEEELTTLT